MDKGGIAGHPAKVFLSVLQEGLDGIAEDGYRGIAAEIEVEKIAADEQHEYGKQEVDVPAENIDKKRLHFWFVASRFYWLISVLQIKKRPAS